MREDLQACLQATRGLRLRERRDEVRERPVVDAPADLRRSDGEAGRQMGLTDTGRPEEDNIRAPLDEAELVQAFDLLTTQRGLEGEIEVPELLDHRQPARAHRGLQSPVVAELNLGGEETDSRVRQAGPALAS